MRHRTTIAAALAALSLGLAACGSKDSTEGDPKAKDVIGKGAGQTTTPATAKPGAAPASLSTGTDLKVKPVIKPLSGPAPTKLGVRDLVVGTGPAAKQGDQLTVDYVGVLAKNAQEFDASWGKQPFPFALGSGGVIPGWDQGIPGMKAGGRRVLLIPADLAYGAQGSPPKIGPNEPLIFVVDLKKIG